jgi:hypothetical protein
MREDIAWAAGLFEGEGCCYLRKRNDRQGRYVRMEVAMTDRDVIERFAQAVGFGKVDGPWGPYGRGTLPVFRWTVAGFERVQAAAAMVWPWLSPRRREQVRDTLLNGSFRRVADPT